MLEWKQVKSTPRMNEWESRCKDFTILHKPGSKVFMLVSFVHDPVNEDDEFWRRPFKTLEEAQNYANLLLGRPTRC